MNRIDSLREVMKKHSLSAIILPSGDPHNSEYVASKWKEREYISGFNGSAGTAVVTLSSGALWTDSRYFLQAEKQLEESKLILMRDGEESTPTIADWIGTEISKGDRVAINPEMMTISMFNNLQSSLSSKGITVVTDYDCVSEIWSDRPELSEEKITILSEKQTGESSTQKISTIRTWLESEKIDHAVYSSLDEIAWLLNIRAKDIAYNPLVISFCVVSKNNTILFVDSKKIDEAIQLELKANGVEIKQYTEFYEYLTTLNNVVVALDDTSANYKIYTSLVNSKVVVKTSIIKRLKAIKNEVELSGIRNCMPKDGAALVRLFMWIEDCLKKGVAISELCIVNKLYEYRSQLPNFAGESFATIAGYAENGAIVHYTASPDTNKVIVSNSLLLLDSGGQFYGEGTTDITRTVALGRPTKKQKTDYTLVLKGHIAMSLINFPKGVKGYQIDALARQFLWNNKRHYGHGTGHGIGHYLSVHEGPQGIRMDANPTPLEPGMVISNEPGLYRAGEYGIRTENLVAVRKDTISDFGEFYSFETLTLFPYDSKLISRSLLTKEERKFINDYHKRVYKTISPLLTKSEQKWLLSKTRSL